MLRAVKNRFGSTNEIGVFDMTDRGMVEVPNPSQLLLDNRTNAPGSIVTASVEGSRPLLAEVQALVCTTAFGTPRRMATGVDYNRVALLTAVLEKRAGIRLLDQDIYVNAAGGIRLDEPAADLSIALAIASAFRAKPLGDGVAVFGEIGLTGEIRPVSRADIRLAECARSGYNTLILPQRSVKGLAAPPNMELFGVAHLSEALLALG